MSVPNKNALLNWGLLAVTALLAAIVLLVIYLQ